MTPADPLVAIGMPCPLCSSTDSRRALVNNARNTGYRLVECERCGLRFFDPGPSQLAVRQAIEAHGGTEAELCRDFGVLGFGELGKVPPKHQRAFLRHFAQERYWRCVAFLGETEGKPKVYEVGTGTGWFLHQCLVQGAHPESTGCDANQAAVAVARGKPGVRVFFGTFQQAGLPGKPYDVFIFNDVLEHSLTPYHDLRKAWNASSKGLSVLYVKTFLDELDVPRGRTMMRPPEHVIHFTRKSLHACLAAGGWDVLIWEENERWSQVVVYAKARES